MLQVRIKKKLGNFLLDVDFSMDGGIFAILGASGCGKSMTLKCIAGIERPDEGRIVLNDRVLFDSAKRINLPPQKRKVGYMFQDYALFPTMNVVQNIQAGMGRKPDPKKVREYITGFQLGGLERHMPDQLSGGQKQRVAMARMLAAEPEVLNNRCWNFYKKYRHRYCLYLTAGMKSIDCVIRSAVFIRGGWK